MAWARQHLQQYYFRSVRVDGRVRRLYLGRGAEALLAEALVQQRRLDRLRRRAWRDSHDASWEAADRPLRTLIDRADMLAVAALFASGFATYNGSSWHRRRNSPVDHHQHVDDPEASLEQLVQRARSGDLSILPELRAALDADPGCWQRYGDLALQAQAAWLDLLSGQDLLLRESVERKMTELRGRLLGVNPSAVEELLVERVLACYVQVHFADALYAQAKGPHATPAVLKVLMARQDSAQRRYLAALRQFGQVQKLLGAGRDDRQGRGAAPPADSTSAGLRAYPGASG